MELAQKQATVLIFLLRYMSSIKTVNYTVKIPVIIRAINMFNKKYMLGIKEQKGDTEG